MSERDCRAEKGKKDVMKQPSHHQVHPHPRQTALPLLLELSPLQQPKANGARTQALCATITEKHSPFNTLFHTHTHTHAKLQDPPPPQHTHTHTHTHTSRLDPPSLSWTPAVGQTRLLQTCQRKTSLKNIQLPAALSAAPITFQHPSRVMLPAGDVFTRQAANR